MKHRAKYSLIFLILTVVCLQCSPASEPSPDYDVSQVTILSPAKGVQNIPVTIELTWNRVDGATEYEVQISDKNSFSNLIFHHFLNSTTLQISGLPFETTIYWRVRASVNNEVGPWSQSYDFKTIKMNSSTPQVTLTSPEKNADGQPLKLMLEWHEIDGVKDYQIQLSKTDTFSNTIFDEIVNQTNFQTDGLESGETYYWRVQVYESKNWSEVWNFNTEAPHSMTHFVGASNSDFFIDGEVLRFAGTNAYYLPNYEKRNSNFVTNTLDIFEETGITVVRMWGFYDGFDCGYSQQDASENVIQTAPGEYNESALQDLDNVIAKGKSRGIRFILTLINYWDDLGGICQYNTWDGAANPSTNMRHFLNSSNAQKWYKDYIKMLLNRVNTVTGIAYKNEPAVFAWEIMNEGRNNGQDPSMLRDWYEEIAEYIKSIDSNHLVSTGEEGFDEGKLSQYSINQYSNTYILDANEGTSYIMNTAIPEIDFGSAHWYPEDWGFGGNASQNVINAQRAWMKDHQEIAASLGKPFILGEYGYPGESNQAVTTIYKDLWTEAEKIDFDGNLLWQLTINSEKCYEFSGNICWPGGRMNEELYNGFKNHIQQIESN